MKKLLLFLTITSFILTSCKDETEPIDATEPTVAPVTYNFSRNGTTTVSYSGQSTRIAMGQEFISALKDEAKSEAELDAMFDHQSGNADFSDANLNASSKNIRSKTAASTDLFSSNTTDATAIKNQFDSWVSEQVSDVFPNWSTDAAPGVAGKIQEAGGGSTRYVNGKGIEINQAINKGLIGALMTDQMLNNYLGTAVLDAGTNTADNDAGTLADGKNYTTMEHKWDEGFGYLYGADDQENPTLGADSFLNKYLARVDGDTDFQGIATTIYDAFKLGRAAIVNKDYLTRDAQVDIIRENVSKVIAIRAVYYLQQGKANLGTDWASSFHDLSEGFGFVYSLQFTRKPGTTSAYFSTSEVNAFITTLTSGNGLWDLTADQLDTMSETIATRFGISVAQAGS
ncbi:MAG: DUF4856 domain-containing protein [Flavobacterium sp.]|jgi:hypothetical protein|nr:DUF4856 domain-containing protein [Flavobacterium sp.]